MDKHTLIDALRGLKPQEVQWKFALYNTKKSRDGLELEWHICKMKGIATWIEALKDALLEKPIAERTVEPYSPFLSDKETICVLERGDSAIRSPLVDTLLNIKNGLESAPETFVSEDMPRMAGYAFYGEYFENNNDADESEGDENNEGDNDDNSGDKSVAKPKQVLFMRTGNPFIPTQKARLCISASGEAVTCEKPLLKFTAAADFVLIDDFCYFFSSGIEKHFDMENRHIALAVKCLETIAENEIISNFDKLEAVATSKKNAKKFIDFDSEILEHIAKLEMLERAEFLATYGVTIDRQGLMDTSDSEQCELIIDLLCNRSAIDPLGRLVTGSNITPRE